MVLLDTFKRDYLGLFWWTRRSPSPCFNLPYFSHNVLSAQLVPIFVTGQIVFRVIEISIWVIAQVKFDLAGSPWKFENHLTQ